jgi:hypothetical protein
MLASIPNVFIAYGDPTSVEPFRVENKYLILKVGDNYEDLTCKTTRLFQAVCWLFPGQGLVKCDDDIIPCIPDLQKKLLLLESYHYAGNVQRILTSFSSTHHKGKTKDRKYDSIAITTPKCCYAAGPLYYVSYRAMQALVQRPKYYNFYEDVFVGYNLNQMGLYPAKVDLYTDTLTFPLKASYQNPKKKIYCQLHGELGNQLFQVASCFGLAMKHERPLILVGDTLYASMFQNFNRINESSLPQMDVYEETDSKQWFKVNEVVGNNDVFVKAYLQNENYFKDCDVRRLFIQPEVTAKVLESYPLAPLSVFIHVRDYVNNDTIDDTYYSKALNIVKADHYYVVSNDVAFCRSYAVFEGLNVTLVDDTPLNSLYLMTLCSGGICSNSSFSWWGGYLNETPNKMIVFPNHWINNGEDVIRFEGSIGV